MGNSFSNEGKIKKHSAIYFTLSMQYLFLDYDEKKNNDKNFIPCDENEYGIQAPVHL